jgi:uncharacterized protein (DUF885 family)
MSQRVTTDTAGFDRTVDSYYKAWFRYHPEAAVEAGVPGYARLLTPFGDEERGALVNLNDALIDALDELDGHDLTDDQRLDRQVLRNSARLENQRLVEIDPTRVNPAWALPVNAVYQLLIRPVAEFPEALAARLAAIPAHLASARDFMKARAAFIPPLWLQSAVIGARRGAEFLEDLPNHPKVTAFVPPIAGLDASIAAAAQALQDYADCLEHDIGAQAHGEFACGRKFFDELLQRRHFLGIDADSLHAYGEELFAHTRAELATVCRELGAEDAGALAKRIQADHPPAAELLAVYRREMQAAHDFLASRALVTLPAVTRLEVVETPVFLRHQIPFAAYSEPSPNDPAQQGYYYVTPPRDAAELAEHDYAGLRHTCVHEAWPGHHLQFVTANLNPPARSLPRFFNASATLYEGWALYCEQLMHEQGFLDRPENRFILLKDRLWRALRIVIDVEIHTRGLSLDAAADRMVAHLGFPRSQALAELTWYSQAPTVPMGYAVGWALINALRAQQPPGFALREFHDRLLSQGSIALALVVRRAFGEGAWAAAKQAVFIGAATEPAHVPA